MARVLHAERANVPIEALLERHAFALDRILDMDPDFLTDDSHSHAQGVFSVSIEATRPIDPEKFQAWMGELLQEKGADLLRTKGILAHPNEERRFAFQAVHMIAEGDYIGPWKDGEERRSKLVFIGRDLNRPQLRRGFEACQVPA
jgi:G3E family GTPase